ncbi:MAG: hypothetical protein V2A61_05405, partial [Calditrichota bacterium]
MGGDIWTISREGGLASRLTTHPSYEHSPRWSPDGKWIAFTAEREGDNDVYVIPSAGGQSHRLTYLDSDDRVCDFSADSQSLIFTSRRDDYYPDFWTLYKVDLRGGTPLRLFDAYGKDASVSPDGESILFIRNGIPWWRKHCRSSDAGQVWIYHIPDKRFETVTDTGAWNSGDDFRLISSQWPLWGADGSIYVVSERSGASNLWKLDKEHQWSQVTFFKEDGVRFPSLSREGRILAFEQGTDIWILEEGQTARRLAIQAPLDDPTDRAQTVRYSDHAGQAAWTTDGKQLLVEVRGEIFAGRITEDEKKDARGRANCLTSNHWARDGDFTVSPGGDSLVFTSDRGGNKDLYLLYAADSSKRELARAWDLRIETLTSDPSDESNPIWSPDGKNLAFIRGKGDLIIRSFADGRERVLFQGWSTPQFAWSPDSRWIAYSREDDEYNSDIYVIPAAGGVPVNVSRHPDEDERPVWSGDGSKLAFRSKRRDNNWDVFYVFLKLIDHEKSLADWAEEAWLKGDKKKDEKEEGADKETKPKK